MTSRADLELQLEKNKLATALQLVPMSDEQRARVTERLVELMSVRREHAAAMLRSTAPRRPVRAAELVDICLQLGQRPCAGGDCDIGRPCPRHGRSLGVAERYLRMKGRE